MPRHDRQLQRNATGTGLSYQWSKNGAALVDQTSSSLSLNNVTAADAGTYTITLTGTCGNPVTHSATLTVNENVVVASAPVSLTNCPGTTASFSVSATGTGLNYQWLKDGLALPGATSSTLTLNNVASVHAGPYAVVVRGTCGNAVTNSATLTVNENVVVASAPISLTNCPGTTASFNVSATGTGLSYQWFKDRTPLPGQTASTLVLNNISSADAGVYSVEVTGVCGNPVSQAATLTVNENLVVTVVPPNSTNCPGASAIFTVQASGTGLNYQWYKSGALLLGQTNDTLVIPAVGSLDAGAYTVVVEGVCGQPATNHATLVVNENVVVASAPVSLTNCPGTTASFSVNATGTGLSYQWSKNGTDLVNQTTSSLTLNNVTAADAGTYTITVTGTCGNPVTRSATLTVNENIVVASAPVSLTNCPGTTASFSVSATGTGLSYQWIKDGTALVGRTGSTLVLNSVTSANAGTYAVVVSGTCGNSVTNFATLAVNQNVVVASAPVSLTNCPGTTASFNVSATGTGLSYQWSKNGAALVDQTSSSLSLNNVTAADAGTYTITLTGTCGNPVTRSATLTVNENVVVVSAPVSLTNCPGTTASFNVNCHRNRPELPVVQEWRCPGRPDQQQSEPQ